VPDQINIWQLKTTRILREPEKNIGVMARSTIGRGFRSGQSTTFWLVRITNRHVS
jgi:hypothetical protein